MSFRIMSECLCVYVCVCAHWGRRREREREREDIKTCSVKRNREKKI